MAEENNDTEQKTESNEAVEKPAGTVKKKAAKKKVAKKKVAKKRAVSKKKAAVKKQASKPAATPESPKAQASEPALASQAETAKTATVTAVVTAASPIDEGGEKRPAARATTRDEDAAKRADTAVESAVILKKPAEDPSMSTESKSAGGFWIKVIFWLLIIVLAFIYIRSLAKHPAEETSMEPQETSQEVTASDAAQDVSGATGEDGEASDESARGEVESAQLESDAGAATTEQLVESEPATESQPPSGEVSEAGAAAVAQPGDTAQTGIGVSDEQVPSGDTAATDEAASSEPAGAAEAVDEGAAQATADTSATETAAAEPESAPSEQKTMRELHEESVAKILKEFDELRDAARAEMEAMHNLMQAERELRDAMAPPPPPAYPPSWRTPNAGYGPYGPAPQPYPAY